MYLQTRTTRAYLFLLLALLAQGCSTYRIPCSPHILTQGYQAAPDYKAIAQYIDRETNWPPSRLGDISTECWYISEADSREGASLAFLEACNNSLQELDKFTEWNCELVVEGNQFSFAEKARILKKEELSRSYANRNGGTVYVESHRTGPDNESRNSAVGSKGKKN